MEAIHGTILGGKIMSDRWINDVTGNVEMIQGNWRIEVEFNDGTIEFVDQDGPEFDEWFERCVDYE